MNCFCWESNIFLIIDRNIFKIFIGKDCFLAGICQSIANGNINHNVPLRNEKCKSSHQRRSIITGVLENFAKFTGKHVCQSLFFNKVAGPRLGTLIKKRLWHKCFLVNFAKCLRTSFLTEKLRWLLLSMVYILPEFYVSYEFK